MTYMESKRRGTLPLTPEIIGAAGRDAGNRSMRRGGRTSWAKKDYTAAVRMSNRLTRALHSQHGENWIWVKNEE